MYPTLTILFSVLACAVALAQSDAQALSPCQEVRHRFWKDLTEALLARDRPTLYRNAVEPLATMTKLSYTGKHDVEPVQGFKLMANMTPEVGLNVLAYEGLAPEYLDLVVVAFRGTTTLSDKCADQVLWHPELPLPARCKRFTKGQLDYYEQATQFVRKVESKAPRAQVMFTGHSLGASLSEAFALLSKGKRPSLCFAAAGVTGPAKHKGIPLEDTDRTCAVQIDHPYDPVVDMSKAEQVGVRCVYQNISEPLACRLYDHGKNPLFFESCFVEAHRFINYLHLLELPQTPTCSNFVTPVEKKNEHPQKMKVVSRRYLR